MSTPNKAACPTAQFQAEITQLSIALVRQMRATRRLIQYGACASCTNDPILCPVLSEFDRAVNAALQQVCEEWNMGTARG